MTSVKLICTKVHKEFPDSLEFSYEKVIDFQSKKDLVLKHGRLFVNFYDADTTVDSIPTFFVVLNTTDGKKVLNVDDVDKISSISLECSKVLSPSTCIEIYNAKKEVRYMKKCRKLVLSLIEAKGSDDNDLFKFLVENNEELVNLKTEDKMYSYLKKINHRICTIQKMIDSFTNIYEDFKIQVPCNTEVRFNLPHMPSMVIPFGDNSESQAESQAKSVPTYDEYKFYWMRYKPETSSNKKRSSSNINTIIDANKKPSNSTAPLNATHRFSFGDLPQSSTFPTPSFGSITPFSELPKSFVDITFLDDCIKSLSSQNKSSTSSSSFGSGK